MALACARCDMPLPEWELGSGGTATCTSCGSQNQARIFPAALRAPTPITTETALEGEAACFDHPGKRAVSACRHCGRFVCPLCSVAFGEGIWCPSCVAAGAGPAREANPETSRVLYDSIALIAPLLSLLLWPFTLIAGPGAVVFSILKWNAPLSPVRHNRWRFVVGVLAGLAETAGWVLLIGFMIARARARGR
jgi:hypothetical protein